MRVVISNFGTTGDVQPFLALAVQLRERGHEPVLAFSPQYSQFVKSRDLTFVPIGPDMQETQRNVNQAWMAMRMAMPQSAAQMKAILAPLIELVPEAFAALRDLCRNADVLISGPAQPAARMIHELTGIPFVSVQLSNFGGAGPPELQAASAELINPFRAQQGLPPIANPLTLDANSPQLALYAISRHVLPRPANWPDHYHLTGYFFLDDTEAEINPALAQFMASGDRPLVVTFGSMTGTDPQQLTTLLLKAVAMAGCRAVIQQNWENLDIGQLPPQVFPAGYVPHAWLFRRAGCIVHHGGGGTAGAVFRSGVPSVFVPHGLIFDQYYFAILAEELGVAGTPIPFSELTVEWLSAAIQKTMTNPGYYEAAALLGERVRSEHGVQKACQLIEDLVARVGFTTAATVSVPTALARNEKINRRKAFQEKRRTRGKEQ